MKRVFILFVMIFLLISCGGKKEVKRETLESKIAKEAFSLVETIKNSFVVKDIKTIESNTSKEGLAQITKDIMKFDTIELVFKPVWVEIESDKVLLNVSWQSRWHKDNRSYEERGMAVFVLRDKPLKIDKIIRTNPFEYPE
ncbi:MAG: hypothetical protein N3A59_03785 [Thermodesulfovibrionales bacterium]|nr:hypothetical protein [Thermodesulfovibrionales bacterium]